MNTITLIDGVESSNYFPLKEARFRMDRAIENGADEVEIWRWDAKNDALMYRIESYNRVFGKSVN